jgi:hypothetical protein
MFFFAVFFGDICQLLDQCCLSQRLHIENADIDEVRVAGGESRPSESCGSVEAVICGKPQTHRLVLSSLWQFCDPWVEIRVKESFLEWWNKQLCFS